MLTALAGLTMAATPSRARAADRPVVDPPAVSSDIRSYLRQPGDQVRVVPDGTYTAGPVVAAHPATDGALGGWLVLVAQTRNGVTVDLSTARLSLDRGTSRILFVGFRFVDGSVDVQGNDVAFWYTEHTFPIETWDQQFRAAGGDRRALSRMVNGLPRAISVGRKSGGPYRRTSFYGVDIHDVGDDGIFLDKSSGAAVEGARMWAIDEKKLDPGFNPWRGGDLFHNDAIQIPGAVDGLTLADSYLGQAVTIGGDNANAVGLQLRDLWMARSDGAALVVYVKGGFQVSGSMRGLRAWSNGYKQRPYQAGWDRLRADVINGKVLVWPRSHGNPRLQLRSDGSNLEKAPPPGVTVTGGRMLDEDQALDHPDNPANVWRQRHPYESWPTLFLPPTFGALTLDR